VVGDLLASRAQVRRHHIACGMALSDGSLVCSINVVSNLGTASVCAEQVVLAEALRINPVLEVSLILALRASFIAAVPDEIVPPCGRCRELLLEYANNAHIVLPSSGNDKDCRLVSVRDLLPSPFIRRGA
jgi:cytidine deaminase